MDIVMDQQIEQIAKSEITEADCDKVLDNVEGVETQRKRKRDDVETNSSVSETLGFTISVTDKTVEDETSSDSDTDIEILGESGLQKKAKEEDDSDLEILEEIYNSEPSAPKIVNGRLSVFDESLYEKDEAEAESGEDDFLDYTKKDDEYEGDLSREENS